MKLNKNSTLTGRFPKELLVIGQGGDITLEEKLLLKNTGELAKYSFSPVSADEESRDLFTKRPNSKYSDTKFKVYDAKPRAFVDYITSFQMSKEEMGDEIEKYLAKQENRFQSVIQNIKGLLEKEKVKNRKLNHKQAMQGI